MYLYLHVPFTTTSVITQSGQTALMEAARWGRTKVVVELVKAKANLDLQNNVCHYSVYTSIIIYMIEEGYMKYMNNVCHYSVYMYVHVCTLNIYKNTILWY